MTEVTRSGASNPILAGNFRLLVPTFQSAPQLFFRLRGAELAQNAGRVRHHLRIVLFQRLICRFLQLR